jgi:hypothetical protein
MSISDAFPRGSVRSFQGAADLFSNGPLVVFPGVSGFVQYIWTIEPSSIKV